MYRNTIAAVATALIASFGPEALAAQVPGSAVRISPVAGWYQPTQNLGSVAEAGADNILSTESSVMLGVTVEAPVPGSSIGLRGQILFAPTSGLSTRRFTGFEPCGTSCERATYTHDPLTSGSVLLGVVDAVVRGPRVAMIRPYAAIGGGLRRYDFERASLSPAFAEALTGDATRFVAHVGIGVVAAVGRAEISVEAGDYLGRYTVGDPSGESTDSMQHDFGITAGIRLR